MDELNNPYADIMEQVDLNYDELAALQRRKTNKELDEVLKMMKKEFKYEKKPNSWVQRIFIDVFGAIVLYLFLFVACDFTRSVFTGSELFGFKWIIFGPYYFITDAPLLTRIWKSKKFLEDLSEVRQDLRWPDTRSCSDIGDSYEAGCRIANIPHRHHPIRDHIGDGLDWVIRHTIGKHFGGILGNATCEDQGTTIGRECVRDRVQAAWDCYIFLCDIYDVSHRAEDINWPNTVASHAGYFNTWDDKSKQAYQPYYDCYTNLYDIGSTVIAGTGEPSNINTDPDPALNCYRYPSSNGYWYMNKPPWYQSYLSDLIHTGTAETPCYFQQNYKQHMLDWWDPV